MPQYASTLDYDPVAQDFVMSGSSPSEGQPATQLVVAALGLQLGSSLADPTDGIDYSIASKRVENVAALWKAEVERALSRYTRSGVIKNLRVVVEANDSVLRYEVSFTDPRDTSAPVRLSRSVN